MKLPPSHNSYKLETSLSIDQVNHILRLSTLEKFTLYMEKTSKDFIGFMELNRFKLIESWFPLGVACILAGEIKEGDKTVIALKTNLHHGFKGLLWFWIIVMAGLIFWHLMSTQGRDFSIFPYILLFIAALTFRLMLHLVYGLARNHALNKLKNILNLTEISKVKWD